MRSRRPAARNANRSATVTPCAGRSSTSTRSPPWTAPDSSTAKYAPALPSAVTRSTRSGTCQNAASTGQGMRGAVTRTTALPTRHRSPITAVCVRTPLTVRFSPALPGGSSRRSSADQ